MSEVTYAQVDADGRVTGVVQVLVTAGPAAPAEIVEPASEPAKKADRDRARQQRKSDRSTRQDRVDEMTDARAAALRSDLAGQSGLIVLDVGADAPVPGIDRHVDGQWVRDEAPPA